MNEYLLQFVIGGVAVLALVFGINALAEFRMRQGREKR